MLAIQTRKNGASFDQTESLLLKPFTNYSYKFQCDSFNNYFACCKKKSK